MGAFIELFFNGGGPPVTAITTDPFYRPGATESASVYPARTEQADTLRGRNDERVQ